MVAKLGEGLERRKGRMRISTHLDYRQKPFFEAFLADCTNVVKTISDRTGDTLIIAEHPDFDLLEVGMLIPEYYLLVNSFEGTYKVLRYLPHHSNIPASIPLKGVEATLGARGQRYGEFKGHAKITWALKDIMQRTPKWNSMQLSPSMREALDMIAHKIGRILNGDPTYVDSWHDIAGYATLVEQELTKREDAAKACSSEETSCAKQSINSI